MYWTIVVSRDEVPLVLRNEIHLAENLAFLRRQPDSSVDLCYIDPPFNTGRKQVQRAGSYEDSFDDLPAYLEPRLIETIRLLTPNGSLFVHLDYREVHYVKVMLDRLMGRSCFMNEIVWAYDFGARTKKRWSAKHDNILWYVKNPRKYVFDFEAMDRVPYMAPGLVGPKKAARGKTPTDVWWHTIVPTSGKERTGYPTQKPLGILERIVRIHSQPGAHLLDFFAGSGSFGEAAAKFDRRFTLVDQNLEAVAVMRDRLAVYDPLIY